jgi:hypothetical protein
MLLDSAELSTLAADLQCCALCHGLLAPDQDYGLRTLVVLKEHLMVFV